MEEEEEAMWDEEGEFVSDVSADEDDDEGLDFLDLEDIVEEGGSDAEDGEEDSADGEDGEGDFKGLGKRRKGAAPKPPVRPTAKKQKRPEKKGKRTHSFYHYIYILISHIIF